MRAGFVLVGGSSRRMGRNKALLPFAGATLVEHIARQVHAAAGNVTLLGTLAIPGLPVIPDRIPGNGPLGGIHSALLQGAEWNLMVACDMPGVRTSVLRVLFEEAERRHPLCAAALGPEGRPEPLCAVYHRDALPAVERNLARGDRKLMNLLRELDAVAVPVREPAALRNVNTPEDWTTFAR